MDSWSKIGAGFALVSGIMVVVGTISHITQHDANSPWTLRTG